MQVAYFRFVFLKNNVDRRACKKIYTFEEYRFCSIYFLKLNCEIKLTFGIEEPISDVSRANQHLETSALPNKTSKISMKPCAPTGSINRTAGLDSVMHLAIEFISLHLSAKGLRFSAVHDVGKLNARR